MVTYETTMWDNYFTAWLPREIHLFKSSIILEKRCLEYSDSINIILRRIQVEIDREKK